MSFQNYSDTPPDTIKSLQIRLRSEPFHDILTGQTTIRKEGEYYFEMVDSSTGKIVEIRSGDLQNVASVLAGTSITAPMLVAWLDELRALAEATLPQAP